MKAELLPSYWTCSGTHQSTVYYSFYRLELKSVKNQRKQKPVNQGQRFTACASFGFVLINDVKKTSRLHVSGHDVCCVCVCFYTHTYMCLSTGHYDDQAENTWKPWTLNLTIRMKQLQNLFRCGWILSPRTLRFQCNVNELVFRTRAIAQFGHWSSCWVSVSLQLWTRNHLRRQSHHNMKKCDRVK